MATPDPETTWRAILRQLVAEEDQSRCKLGLTHHQRMFINDHPHLTDDQVAVLLRVKPEVVRSVRKRN